MAEISKQALKVDNNQSFPNNNNGAITPAILRAFNVNMIDSLVDEQGYTADSASWNQQIDALEQFTASASGLSTGSLLVTASAAGNVITFTKGDTSTFNVTVATGSAGGDTTQLNQATASLQAFTASAEIRLNNLESTTASLLVETQNLELFSASALVSINALNSATSSYVTETESGSFLLTASFDNGTRNLTFTKGNNTTFAVNIPDASGSVLPSGVISGSAQITELGFVSSSVTASSLITASATGATITFTKGDNTQFSVTVATGSFVSASYAETASLAFDALDIIVNAKNTTGVQLNKGTVVRIIGSTGDNPLIGTASWTNDANSANTLGFVVTDIANDAFGKVMTQGTLLNVNTDPALGYVAGQIVYLSGSGQYTNVKPPAPFHEVRLGQVLRAQQNNGSIYVLVQNGYELEELHDVDINTGSLANNNLLAWNTATLQWENKTVTEVGATTSASFNDYTASNDAKVNSLIAATGSYATTGSNTFTGDQTLIDNAGNFFTISDASGSMMLVAKGFTSASAHMSASAAGIGNFIFKTNSNTPDTIISGSGNIFVNGAAPTTGFKRYIGGSNNIFNTTGLPQLSGSMAFSPTMNGNIGVGTYSFRGPVSASTWTISNNLNNGTITIGSNASQNAQGLTSGLTMTTNIIPGTVTIIANQASFTGSSTTFANNIVVGGANLTFNQSAASLTNNIINDNAFLLTNNYFSSSAGLGSINVNRNNIIGAGHSLIITGSQPAGTTNATQYSDNFMGGGANTIFVDASTARVSGTIAYHSAQRNIIYGTNLIVTASSAAGDTTSYGSAFFGRYNSVTGNADLTAETIFAVGTGTSTSNRKTGFLIDSGSNSFFEGTVNISGSLLVNGIAPSAINTGSFATTGSNSFNGNQTISGSLIVSGSTTFQGNTTFISSTGDTTNIILGNNAMINQSASFENIAIGGFALQNTTGSQNIAIGISALSSNTTGAGAVAIGRTALALNTTGINNFAIGTNALANNTTGNFNFAIGTDSMRYSSGSTVSNNVAIGYETLQRNEVDSQIAIGNNALQKTTTGNVNTAIGRNAMLNNLTGNNNVAIGSNALFSSTASINSIAIGSVAMRDAGASDYNTAIGTAALYNAKSNSSYNVAIGGQALRFHYDGDTNNGQNMAIGTDAMTNMTSGSRNVAIGTGTLRDSSRANRNVLIGTNAGINARPISNNVAIGDGIGTTIAGNENTIIGSSAASNITSGSDNIIIGYNTGDSITSGNNNTVIGSNLSGDASWNNTIAISDGNANIKFFNSGSQTTLTNNTLISGSLTTTGSANIGTVMTLTPLDPLPAGTIGMLAVSSSNQLFFYNGAWTQIS